MARGKKCYRCGKLKPSVILRSSEYWECDECSDYNMACLRHKVFPKWDSVVAGIIPAVPDNHVSAVSSHTPKTPTAPPADPAEPESLLNTEEQMIQSVIQGSNTDAQANNMASGETKSNVFDSIAIDDDSVTLLRGFMDNLPAIYECNKKDITDFFASSDTPTVRNNMVALRLALYQSVSDKFPEYANRDLLNRRTISSIAEDVYILGYVLINNQADKRLNKILKQAVVSLSSVPLFDDTITVAPESAELIDICTGLKQSVVHLTKLVKDLQVQYQELQRRITLQRLDTSAPDTSAPDTSAHTSAPDTSAPDTSAPDNQSSETRHPDSLTDDSHTSSSKDESEGDEEVTALQESGAHTITTNSLVPSAPQTASIQQSVSGGFQLSSNNRKQLRKNGAAQGNKHAPIEGSSDKPHRLSAAEQTGQSDHIRTVYVGNLSPTSTCDDVRAHLGDSEISGIADVFKLSANESPVSSFCVVFDNQRSIDQVYQADNWPRGVKIRPYVKKQLRSVQFGNQNVAGSQSRSREGHHNHQNQSGRTHSHPNRWDPREQSYGRHNQYGPRNRSYSQSGPHGQSYSRSRQSGPHEQSYSRNSQSGPHEQSYSRNSQSGPHEQSFRRNNQSGPHEQSYSRQSEHQSTHNHNWSDEGSQHKRSWSQSLQGTRNRFNNQGRRY